MAEGVAWVGVVRLRVRQLSCRHLANICPIIASLKGLKMMGVFTGQIGIDDDERWIRKGKRLTWMSSRGRVSVRH